MLFRGRRRLVNAPPPSPLFLFFSSQGPSHILDIPVPLLLPLVLLYTQKHVRLEEGEEERHKLDMNDLNDAVAAAAGQDAAAHEQAAAAAAARPPTHKRNFKSQHVSNRSTIFSSSASASAAAAAAFISSKKCLSLDVHRKHRRSGRSMATARGEEEEEEWQSTAAAASMAAYKLNVWFVF